MPIARLTLLKLARKGLIVQMREIDEEIAGLSEPVNAVPATETVKQKRKGWTRARRAAFKKRMREARAAKRKG